MLPHWQAQGAARTRAGTWPWQRGTISTGGKTTLRGIAGTAPQSRTPSCKGWVDRQRLSASAMKHRSGQDVVSLMLKQDGRALHACMSSCYPQGNRCDPHLIVSKAGCGSMAAALHTTRHRYLWQATVSSLKLISLRAKQES
ncbi:MAG: hypothetical protein KatS3mg054_1480 [Chloroflexus sp.]|nr:MAG: hypothetical protein KatS3mg054_1480 [Chloroflexus sp.]